MMKNDKIILRQHFIESIFSPIPQGSVGTIIEFDELIHQYTIEINDTILYFYGIDIMRQYFKPLHTISCKI